MLPFWRFGLRLLLCLLCLGLPLLAQQDPALKVSSVHLVEAYLQRGPSKSELPDGSATANWAIMQKVGLPEFLVQEPLQVGGWSTIWAPVRGELDKRGFSGLDPLEVVTWWDETRKEPQRFLRLLVQRGVLDSRIPKERNRGAALRESLALATSKIDEVRANVRFDKAGWSFTGTASLVPSQRVVRLVLRGSQPCGSSGKTRAANVALKGRLFLDKSSSDGVKVQLLESEFTSNGCEEVLNSKISSLAPLSSGGESRVTGNLVIQVRDESLTGRLQLDVAYRPAGDALQTGHATYSLRGSVSADGSAHATLTPISSSGAKMFREALDKTGALEGQIKAGQGSGGLSLPIFKQPLSWRASEK